MSTINSNGTMTFGNALGGSVTIVPKNDTATNYTVTIPDVSGIISMVGDFTGSNVSLGANGYQKLPSGLIIQWGTYTSAAGNATITFPIAFPTFCINIFDIFGPTTSVNAYAPIVISKAINNAVVWTSGTGTYPHLWLALGY